RTGDGPAQPLPLMLVSDRRRLPPRYPGGALGALVGRGLRPKPGRGGNAGAARWRRPGRLCGMRPGTIAAIAGERVPHGSPAKIDERRRCFRESDERTMGAVTRGPPQAFATYHEKS